MARSGGLSKKPNGELLEISPETHLWSSIKTLGLSSQPPSPSNGKEGITSKASNYIHDILYNVDDMGSFNINLHTSGSIKDLENLVNRFAFAALEKDTVLQGKFYITKNFKAERAIYGAIMDFYKTYSSDLEGIARSLTGKRKIPLHVDFHVGKDSNGNYFISITLDTLTSKSPSVTKNIYFGKTAPELMFYHSTDTIPLKSALSYIKSGLQTFRKASPLSGLASEKMLANLDPVIKKNLVQSLRTDTRALSQLIKTMDKERDEMARLLPIIHDKSGKYVYTQRLQAMNKYFVDSMAFVKQYSLALNIVKEDAEEINKLNPSLYAAINNALLIGGTLLLGVGGVKLALSATRGISDLVFSEVARDIFKEGVSKVLGETTNYIGKDMLKYLFKTSYEQLVKGLPITLASGAIFGAGAYFSELKTAKENPLTKYAQFVKMTMNMAKALSKYNPNFKTIYEEGMQLVNEYESKATFNIARLGQYILETTATFLAFDAALGFATAPFSYALKYAKSMNTYDELNSSINGRAVIRKLRQKLGMYTKRFEEKLNNGELFLSKEGETFLAETPNGTLLYLNNKWTPLQEVLAENAKYAGKRLESLAWAFDRAAEREGLPNLETTSYIREKYGGVYIDKFMKGGKVSPDVLTRLSEQTGVSLHNGDTIFAVLMDKKSTWLDNLYTHVENGEVKYPVGDFMIANYFSSIEASAKALQQEGHEVGMSVVGGDEVVVFCKCTAKKEKAEVFKKVHQYVQKNMLQKIEKFYEQHPELEPILKPLLERARNPADMTKPSKFVIGKTEMPIYSTLSDIEYAGLINALPKQLPRRINELRKLLSDKVKTIKGKKVLTNPEDLSIECPSCSEKLSTIVHVRASPMSNSLREAVIEGTIIKQKAVLDGEIGLWGPSVFNTVFAHSTLDEWRLLTASYLKEGAKEFFGADLVIEKAGAADFKVWLKTKGGIRKLTDDEFSKLMDFTNKEMARGINLQTIGITSNLDEIKYLMLNKEFNFRDLNWWTTHMTDIHRFLALVKTDPNKALDKLVSQAPQLEDIKPQIKELFKTIKENKSIRNMWDFLHASRRAFNVKDANRFLHLLPPVISSMVRNVKTNEKRVLQVVGGEQ